MYLYWMRIKILLRTKGNMFWTFLFPILLGTFFYLGFGTLSPDQTISTIELNIVIEDEYQLDSTLINFAKQLELNNQKMFQVNEIATLDEAEQLLNKESINSYLYYVNHKIQFRLLNNNMDTTLIKIFIDKYLEVETLIQSVMISSNGQADLDAIINQYFSQDNFYLSDRSDTGNLFIIYFYALIAMTCLFASYWGVTIIKDIKADNSPLALRCSIAPVRKFKLLAIYTLAALTVQTAGNIILLGYLKYILGVDFGTQLGWIIFMFPFGGFLGLAFGMFISSIVKGEPQKKEGICTIISLLSSACSGLMSIQVYVMFKKVPLFQYINPGTIISDALNSLAYFVDMNQFFIRIGLMFFWGMLFISIASWKLRGERYASV